MHLSLSIALQGNSLTQTSPFIPEGWQTRETNKAEVQQRRTSQKASPQQPIETMLEFRGIFAISGEHRFNLYEKQTTTSRWLPLNGEGNLVVIKFDQDNRRILARLGNQQGWLNLTGASRFQTYASAPHNKEIDDDDAETQPPMSIPKHIPRNPRAGAIFKSNSPRGRIENNFNTKSRGKAVLEPGHQTKNTEHNTGDGFQSNQSGSGVSADATNSATFNHGDHLVDEVIWVNEEGRQSTGPANLVGGQSNGIPRVNRVGLTAP